MPYIKQEARKALEKYPLSITDAGELNYMLTRVIMSYIKGHALKYQYINDVIGALEGAKAEFYRRVVARYEDQKQLDNGDVYE